LLWEGGHGPLAFRTWLDSLPNGSQLLVFDTTFTGNAVNLIRNVLKQYAGVSTVAPQLDVAILGVLDLSRGKPPDPEEVVFATKSSKEIHVRSEVLGVTNLVTEDRIELVGYDSLRVSGGVSAQWSSAVVLVEDDASKLVQVIGTRSLAATFGELLDGDVRPVALDEPMVARSKALAVGMSISEAARQERGDLQRAMRKGVVTSGEYDEEMRRINSAEKGARRRYQKFLAGLEGKDGSTACAGGSHEP
jgi:hypothetical protein